MNCRITILWIALTAFGCTTQENPSYFYAFGDMPYEDDQVEKYNRLVEHINNTDPVFSIHVGDTKSGHSDCSDEFYMKNLEHLNSFEHPLFYTPGDNEWTDCDRESCGGYDAEERLNVLRKSIFTNPNESFGKEKIKVASQSSKPSFEKYVENVMWEHNQILFSTVHICGSSNNYLNEGDNQEFIEREKAAISWIKNIFEVADENNQKAIVIAFHANVFNNQNDIGYRKILAEMKPLIHEFNKPVLAIYGDTHTFTISQPLSYEGLVLKNFTALQVFGSPNIHLAKINLDLKKDNRFNIEPVYIE